MLESVGESLHTRSGLSGSILRKSLTCSQLGPQSKNTEVVVETRGKQIRRRALAVTRRDPRGRSALRTALRSEVTEIAN